MPNNVLAALLFRRIQKCVLFCLIMISTAKAGFAEGDAFQREYQLKTAYLLHFAELAEWPVSLPINICLQGSSPLRDYLPALDGQLINGLTIHIQSEVQTDFGDCRILFLSNSEELTHSLRELAKTRHILLVSDADNFIEQGGMVQFTLRNNKLKFLINLPETKLANIKLSSKLLRMAEILE